MYPELLIVGAGGFGREIFAMLQDLPFNVVGFIAKEAGPHPLPAPLLGGDEHLPKCYADGIQKCVVALGDPGLRHRLSQETMIVGYELPAIIHPTATLLNNRSAPAGIVVYPNVTVMSDCILSQGVLLNAGSTLGHDVEIGEYTSVGPGSNLAGQITVGSHAYLGIGCTVRENTTIGDHAFVGAGSLVLEDVPPYTMVRGVPAKPIRKLSHD